MAQCNVIVLCFVLATAFNFVHCSNDELKSNVEVEVITDLTNFLLENPGVKLQPLTKETKTVGQYSQTTYRFGQRINGDRLLASDSGSQKWDKPRDVKTNLKYPKSGVGNVVTYLEIVVDQSTNIGQAFVVGGGIGQGQIAVVIEARQTLYFSYNLWI